MVDPRKSRIGLNMVGCRKEESMDFEETVQYHYTYNGMTKIAIIPQYAVPPGEDWSIDLVGVDLVSRSLLFIEVTESQTPSAQLINKINHRNEWIPKVREDFINKTTVVNDTWRHVTVVFVIDSRVEWVKERISDLSDIRVEPLSSCCPFWLTTREPLRGEPRLHS